ncbi:hypothetical protein [Desulfofustis limnaeus]|jgi:hypothetical protein|uniref:Uncharacterized protein n=1 Tax=Desulfofustis limnaeus TaxID=2740163 RepID=A0ABN6M4C9_9BACT|nr:hypothetical protein [Desulfofustis limnaeus]MDX9895389.1 hypothetical protein [Desulfofustis sp.]BDD87736.1 hypothetical protein DPPLL_21010 [Desulfofustis limnaeus]
MHETQRTIDWTDLATHVGALEQGQEIGSSILARAARADRLERPFKATCRE